MTFEELQNGLQRVRGRIGGNLISAEDLVDRVDRRSQEYILDGLGTLVTDLVITIQHARDLRDQLKKEIL